MRARVELGISSGRGFVATLLRPLPVLRDNSFLEGVPPNLGLLVYSKLDISLSDGLSSCHWLGLGEFPVSPRY